MATYYADPNIDPNSGFPQDGASWQSAFGSIWSALDTAGNNDTIKCKDGEFRNRTGYLPDTSENTIIYGGFPPDDDTTTPSHRNLDAHRTIINGMELMQCIDMSDGVTLDGLWFKNGYSDANGGAFDMNGHDNVVIKNCVFTNCTADHGGAVYLANCVNFTIESCDFGLCSATDTTGGAVWIGSGGYGQLVKCRFCGNTAAGKGGAVYLATMDTPYVQLINCIGDHNHAGTDGGFLAAGNNDPQIVESCTICDNTADGTGGGIHSSFANCTLVNSVVRGNKATSNDQWFGCVQTYSNVEGGVTGSNGNIDVDPQFRGDGVHPYEPIAATGNCDSANAGSLNYPGEDYRGRSEYDDPDTSNTGAGTPDYADMGAYEYIGIEPIYLDYSKYFLDFNGAQISSYGKGGFHSYALVRTPYMPPWWCDHGAGKPCKFEIFEEMQIHETDTQLLRRVYVGSRTVMQQSLTGISHANPTWEVDYPLNNQGSETYAALMNDYPEVRECTEFPLEPKPLFSIVTARYIFSRDVDTDELDVMNIFVRPVWDDTDAQTDYRYAMENFNEDTVVNRYEADMPVSAYHIKTVLMGSMLKLLYEARSPMTTPLFGYYYPGVIVV